MKFDVLFSVPQLTGGRIYRAPVRGDPRVARHMLAELAADYYHDMLGGRLDRWPMLIALHDDSGAEVARYEVQRHLGWSSRRVANLPMELVP